MSLYIYPPLQTVSAGSPIEFMIDGIPVQVEIDTAVQSNTIALPSGQWFEDENGAVQVYKDSTNENNSKPLPAGLYYVKDGVIEAVNRDTATPANTRPIPVEIVDITGVPVTLNLTTGDLGVEISHDGLTHTWDSTRVGDGTNLLIVNASGQALVKATELETALALLLTELQLKADLTETQPVSLASQPLPAGAATEATLAAQSAKLPATLGSKADVASLSVTQSTEDKAIQAAIQASTADKDVVENYYKRDFSTTPLTTIAGWVTLRALTASIKKLIITQNGGNELLIRNATSGKEIIVGQGVGMEISLLGVATDVIEISSLDVDSVDGIIYVNFEG